MGIRCIFGHNMEVKKEEMPISMGIKGIIKLSKCANCDHTLIISIEIQGIDTAVRKDIDMSLYAKQYFDNMSVVTQ